MTLLMNQADLPAFTSLPFKEDNHLTSFWLRLESNQGKQWQDDTNGQELR
jgi:hypothetical protein